MLQKKTVQIFISIFFIIMKYFSLSLVVTLIIIGYVINTIWSLIEIFIPPKCNPQDKCFQSYLGAKPVQNLILFSSVIRHPSNQHANKIHAIRNFNYSSSSTFEVKLDLPRKTRNNGTLFLHVALVDNNHLYSDFQELQRTQSVETIPMVIFTEPRAATFNLLNNQDDGDDNKSKLKNTIKTTAHINRDVTFSIFTDDIKLPANKIPGELYPYMRFTNGKYQPIIQHNILKTRLKDLEEITKDTTEIVVSVHYAPVSFGLLRLTLHMKIAIQSLQKLGFSEKDADDVKGIFADTNLYLLSATIFIASFHLLFDFLAFKNDVSFWRGKKSMAGLSIRTVLWRAFSQSVILLYLFDEKTSMIVLIPAVIGAIIELWKAKKVLRVGIEWSGVSSLPRLVFHEDNNSAEQRTRAVDAEAMRYLCYLLYPLCIAGAFYSLLYEPHKSWYSWSLHSLVNGVYAFGFLFMLPQLFVNYKLKSVAALPWRAFMYKAFNTFIDDIFAFIITMPTAHRVACFRDDIVFLIYLYQRWLYPVDISRLDDSVSISENIGAVNDAVDEKKRQ